jgi:hypothetical protein
MKANDEQRSRLRQHEAALATPVAPRTFCLSANFARRSALELVLFRHIVKIRHAKISRQPTPSKRSSLAGEGKALPKPANQVLRASGGGGVQGGMLMGQFNAPSPMVVVFTPLTLSQLSPATDPGAAACAAAMP